MNLTDLKPYDVIKARLPFELYPFQVQVMNDLAPLQRAGYYLDTGCGKTATATASALYKMTRMRTQAIVLMPPILSPGWKRWLERCQGVKVLAYRGSPVERKALDLNEPDFILMSYQIFKKDFDRLYGFLLKREFMIIADEATALKNVTSDNHKKFNAMTAGHDIMLLTGTPLSTPLDGYAYIKMIAPGIYRNMHHFENVHVAERDFFGNIVAWQNLNLLAENMTVNARRVLKEEALKDLPPITHTPIYYELDPEHHRLYVKLAEEQLLKLEDGGKIDATSAPALYHALGQIISNYHYFSGDPSKISKAIDLIDEVMEELGGKKLVLFANYRMTNKFLVEYLVKYNARSVYGDVSRKQQDAAIETFINDETCKLLALQPRSAGFGVDGLQHVCNDVLFLEIPTVPMWFHQSAARLHRGGQMRNVNVRIAVAERTCNVRQFNDLMQKDALIGRVMPNIRDLRDAMFGG